MTIGRSSMRPIFTIQLNMARKVTKQQLKTGAGWGWAKKLFKKAKTHVVKHVKKHGRRAMAHAKKVGKAAAKQAKAAAIAAGKEMLEQAKEEGKALLQQTVEEATEAAVGHVRKHVCSTVGSGFFNKEKKKLHALAKKELNAVHKKGIAHIRSGGKKGAGLDDHVNKAKDRVEKSVERIKNGAKAKIRAVAGCDEGEGLRVKGAGLRKKQWPLKKMKKGAGLGKRCRCK